MHAQLTANEGIPINVTSKQARGHSDVSFGSGWVACLLFHRYLHTCNPGTYCLSQSCSLSLDSKFFVKGHDTEICEGHSLCLQIKVDLSFLFLPPLTKSRGCEQCSPLFPSPISSLKPENGNQRVFLHALCTRFLQSECKVIHWSAVTQCERASFLTPGCLRALL